MGYRGFCTVRPDHVAGMAKRYRQLLGERRYTERNESQNSEKIVVLAQAISSLGQSILICDPTADLSLLKPMQYRPPEPLPGAALMRSALSTLRISALSLNIECLVEMIAKNQSVQFSNAEEKQRFRARIPHSLNGLVARGILQQRDDKYNITRMT